MHRSPRRAKGGSILGAEQTRWLEERLVSSRATFKLLVSGSIWGPGIGETWMHQEGARDALFELLAERRIGGVVLLSGDLHRSVLRRLPRPAAYALPEITSSPLATPRTWRCPAPSDEVEEIACVDGGNAVAILSFDTAAADPLLDVRILDEEGRRAAGMEIRRSQLD